MSNEPTYEEKYLAQLEALFMITMKKLGNDVVITDEELQSITPDSILDVTNVNGGIRLTIVENV
jgi:hypothetical protein